MNKKQTQIAVIVICMIVCLGIAAKMFLPPELFGGGKTIQVKNESRDHLKVTSLYSKKGNLASVGQNPFDNPLLQPPPKPQEKKQEEKKPAPTPPADIIPVTPVMQREQQEPPLATRPDKAAEEKDEKRDVRLKAIASSGDRKVAVIEYQGKTTSVFIGSAVGKFIVTDIGDNTATLQSLDGKTISVELVS